MGEWQDISTAPKDGSRILLAGPDGIDIGCFSVLWGWRRDMTAEYDNEMAEIRQPTHWMPLPTPPEATS